MSTIGREEVLYVARLAALDVPEHELAPLVDQLRRIVSMVEQLSEVPAAEQAPQFIAGPPAAPLRPDIIAPEPLAHSPAEMAPGFKGGFFTVPRHAAMEGE